MSSQSSISSELSLGSNAVPEEEAEVEAEDDEDDASPPALALLLLLPFPLPAAATGDDDEEFFARIRLAAGVALARGCPAGFAIIVARPWSAEPAGVDWWIGRDGLCESDDDDKRGRGRERETSVDVDAAVTIEKKQFVRGAPRREPCAPRGALSCPAQVMEERVSPF